MIFTAETVYKEVHLDLHCQTKSKVEVVEMQTFRTNMGLGGGQGHQSFMAAALLMGGDYHEKV